MSFHQSRKLKVAVIWAAILVVGAACGWGNYRGRKAELITQLIDEVRRAAVVFDDDSLDRLTGTREDLDSPAYAAVKTRLRKLVAVDPRIRFAHLLRTRADAGRVVVLASSAERGAREESLPGDEYHAGSSLRTLGEIMRTGRPAADGPRQDASGPTMTSYALIGESALPARGGAGKTILGIDLDAAGWHRALWQAGFEGAFYVWILLGLPWAAWLVTQRQDEQRKVIRNLSEAMEQSHSAIMIVALDDRIEYANRGLCQQAGYTRRELIGRNWHELHLPRSGEMLLAEIMGTVRSGQPWEGDWSNRRKDGSVYPVHGVITPVKHRDDSLACFVAVFDDVSDTRRREAELREARDAALAGDRAKGQFLATMSHEVRTPLNGIVGFTSLLLETSLTPEQREYVQTIRMSTEALIQLTGDILDFARIESGKLKLDPVACDPRECIEDALDLFAGKAADKNLELLHHVADDVPAAVVTDGRRLRQVLANLIGNAVKFTEKGEVEVRVTLAPEQGGVGAKPQARNGEAVGGMSDSSSTETCRLLFTVRDTGVGIAAEHHAKLFRPFSQVDESTTRRYSGTGLGLAICRNLVELMGGAISLDSEPGRGSTFTFIIRTIAVAPLPPKRDLGGLRLGLAVRSASLRRELAELLRSWEADVVEADTAGALARAAWEVALVEVDCDAANELLRHEPSPGLPPEKTFGVVPVTLPNELRTGLRAHFRLLVNKPVHHDALFALLTGSRASVPTNTSLTQFGYRVLVVEDNPLNQRLIERVLAHLGCTATIAAHGREAMAFLEHQPAEFDVVLLDLHMPEMDGLAALQEIRAGKAGPRAQAMWIVALTADARREQRTRALEAGLNDYLTKPLNILELEAALKKFRAESVSIPGMNPG